MTYTPKYLFRSAQEVADDAHQRWFDARMDDADHFFVPKSLMLEMACYLDLWHQMDQDSAGNPSTSYKGLKVYIEPEPVAVPVPAPDPNLPDVPQPTPNIKPPATAAADLQSPLVVNPATGQPTLPEDVVVNPLTGERVQKEVVLNPVTGVPIK